MKKNKCPRCGNKLDNIRITEIIDCPLCNESLIMTKRGIKKHDPKSRY